MTVRVYKSTDSSAPTLSGTAGDLTALLDAILVNGYGSKTAAGWAIEFTGTNKRVYRPASGTRFRLRVVDDGTGSAVYGRVYGGETATDVDTLGNLFPTAAQLSGGYYWHKSSTASATTRDWVCYASATRFYLFINSASGTNGGYGSIYSFGGFSSFTSGDAYNCHISGGLSTTQTAANQLQNFYRRSLHFSATQIHGYLARAYNGIGGSVPATNIAAGYLSGESVANATWQIGGKKDSGSNPESAGGAVQYPNPPDSNMMLGRLYLSEGIAGLRGYLPGVWVPSFQTGSTQPAHFDTMGGAGALAGRTFEIVGIGDSNLGAGTGRVIVETSDNW